MTCYQPKKQKTLKQLNLKDFLILAEEAGFEPACQISLTIRFRIGAVMATSVPLRRGAHDSTGNKKPDALRATTD